MKQVIPSKPKNLGRLIAAVLLALFASSCAGTPPVADIPHCERYVPPSMRAPLEGVDIPEPAQHPDGHQDAEPWMIGYLGQTGQLDKANDMTASVDFIYRTCLDEHRGQLKKATAPWWKRPFL